jgi:hypothetical protein
MKKIITLLILCLCGGICLKATDKPIFYMINTEDIRALNTINSKLANGKLTEILGIDSLNMRFDAMPKIRSLDLDTLEIKFDGADTVCWLKIVAMNFYKYSDVAFLKGSIKYFNEFKYLTSLSIRDNSIVELDSLNSTVLKALYISGANLGGTVPLLKNLNLERLDLSGNNFEGAFPKFEMENLNYLNLSNNSLTGNFPDLSTYKKLKSIDISYNKFYGEVNGEISGLDSFDIASNNFNGELPLQKLKNIVSLKVSHNKFNKLPGEIYLPRCEEFYIDNNEFSGVFPYISFTYALKMFVINDNEFTGMDNRVNIFTDLGVNLSRNRLDFDDMEHFDCRVDLNYNSPNYYIRRFPQKPLYRLQYDKENNRVICPINGAKIFCWQLLNSAITEIIDSSKNYIELKDGVSLSNIVGCEAMKKVYEMSSYVPELTWSSIRVEFDTINDKMVLNSEEIDYLNKYFKEYYTKDTNAWRGWPLSSKTLAINETISHLGFKFDKINDTLSNASVNSLILDKVDMKNFDYSKVKFLQHIYFDSCAVDISKISALTNLKTIDINRSKFDKNISEFASTELEKLVLNDCGMTGVFPQIKSTLLNTIEVRDNSLVFDALDLNATNLKSIKINNNQAKSLLPKLNYQGLEKVIITNSKFTGKLENFEAPNLWEFNISNNNLEGDAPTFILPRAKTIDLSQNNFSGELKQFQCDSLVSFKMRKNRAQTTIADTLKYLLLKNFEIDSSNFSGDLACLFFAERAKANFSFNNFSGELPQKDISGCRYTLFDVSYNNFTGAIPDVNNLNCLKGENPHSYFNFNNNRFNTMINTGYIGGDLSLNVSHNKIIHENLPIDENFYGYNFVMNAVPQDTSYSMHYLIEEGCLKIDSKLEGNLYYWELDGKYQEDVRSNKYYVKDKSTIPSIKCQVKNSKRNSSFTIYALYKGEISGVEDEVFSSEINISPNPTQDYIQLNSKLDILDNPQVSIYNQLGEKVAESNSSRIELINLPNGVYRLLLEASGKRAAKSFVISR